MIALAFSVQTPKRKVVGDGYKHYPVIVERLFRSIYEAKSHIDVFLTQFEQEERMHRSDERSFTDAEWEEFFADYHFEHTFTIIEM